MKKITILSLFFVILGLTNCTTQKEKLDSVDDIYRQQEIGKLNRIMKKHEVTSQKFIVPFNKSSKIKGENGTTILVNPNDLETIDGKSINANIEVELKELLNQSQLLKSNAQTVSDGKVLVSGGAYYINMTSNEQKLKLKDGKTLNVEFPKLSDNEMALFYGEKDSLGIINWQPTEIEFKINKTNVEFAKAKIALPTAPMPYRANQNLEDTLEEFKESLSHEEKIKVSRVIKGNSEIALQVYETVQLKQLGWINCDRFLEIKDVTNLKFEFNPKDSTIVASVYLVFKDINSVMENSYFSLNGKTFENSFEGIPLGAKVKLIAFSGKNGEIYVHKSDIIIGENKTVKIDLRKIKEQELGRIFE